MREKTCCFTGHRVLAEPAEIVEARVLETVEQLIRKGYRYFGAGGARGFDALASEAVLQLKRRYPDIHLILVLPFPEQYQKEGNWTQSEIDQYHSLQKRASKVVVLAPAYCSGIYYRRNRHLADHSSACIVYLSRPNSGTGYTVQYATSAGLSIVNLAAPSAACPAPGAPAGTPAPGTPPAPGRCSSG